MKIYDTDGKYPVKVQGLIDQARQALAHVISGHKWITATPILVGSESMAQELIELGAEAVFAIGCAEGIRHSPIEDSIKERLTSHCLDLSFQGDMMDGIRGGEAALNQLDKESIRQINNFDPLNNARVLRTIFSEGRPLANRTVFGARPKEWQALEDKIIIDAFWDKAGVQRAPSITINLSLSELKQAYDLINQGHGVVIAGDAKQGFHGGASRTRWAKSDSQLQMILDDLIQECDQVRVMPLLEGVSCSMHGWIFPNGKYISLRPCEMLVSYSNRETHFEYHGASSFWRPNDRIHHEMREAVEKAAQLLWKDYQYRGVFTVDGIATNQGFYPTELNPRFGGALGRMSVALPELPLLTMHYASIEGYELGIQPQQLRELIISAAETKPIVRAMLELDDLCTQPLTLYYKKKETYWELIETVLETSKQETSKQEISKQDHDAHVKWGTALHGSLAFAYINPDCLTAYEASIDTVKVLLDHVKKHIQESYL